MYILNMLSAINKLQNKLSHLQDHAITIRA